MPISSICPFGRSATRFARRKAVAGRGRFALLGLAALSYFAAASPTAASVSQADPNKAADADIQSANDLCTLAPERRVEAAQQQLQDAWYDLDIHGRAFTGGFNPHSANFGKEPIRPGTGLGRIMEWRHLQVRRLMVKLGALFPQFNHPMDVPMLLDRLRTNSVPAIDLDDPMQPGQTSMLEVFLIAAPDNAEIGHEFVEAMGDLEDELLGLKSGHPAPEVLASITHFQDAFRPFMAATKKVVFSSALAENLASRNTLMCKHVKPAEEKRE